jgi:hypothetical protein
MKNFSEPILLQQVMRSACLFFAAWIVMSVTGCASIGQTKLAAPEKEAKTEIGWWYASFKMNWPHDEEPAWHNDLIIAHRIIAPVLERYKKDIALWRFHRRAVQDEAGHRFSFIFYSTPGTARKVYESIEATALLQEMRNGGIIIKATYDDTGTITKPNIEATSDGHWSQPVQKSWPYFIMGVCQMWLDLIDQFAEDGRQKPSSLDEVEAFYLEIDKNVQETWEKEGGHAYFHHLNAIFGYNPVLIYQKYLLRF